MINMNELEKMIIRAKLKELDKVEMVLKIVTEIGLRETIKQLRTLRVKLEKEVKE